jgi:hypothetical protein
MSCLPESASFKVIELYFLTYLFSSLWRPRFLINVISANDRVSRVKPADPGQT